MGDVVWNFLFSGMLHCQQADPGKNTECHHRYAFHMPNSLQGIPYEYSNGRG
jgi:hypothetical protein